ncbi:signal recognition particle receptor alpha subunit family protein [Striga hermonthica]|uniref:Signal recognition particle receptor alpha subunit family protein n=1 Tax=Striga hermonthica TaxID=68872 RepID=A0A9N7R4K2_STRHE|nr:signal recognition particle receptor alpha subunit family protein [Striga hermonthica]
MTHSCFGMLEQLLIFTRGGLILWALKELGNALRGSPIDTLIRSCFLEERSGDASYNYDGPNYDAPRAAYTLKWTFHNELGLVFVAVYQRMHHFLYLDDLLAMVKKEFSEIYDFKRTSYANFDDIFQQLKKEAEVRAEEMKKSKQVAKPLSNNNLGRKQGQVANGTFDGGNKKKSGNESGKDGDAVARPLENGNHRKNNNNSSTRKEEVISANGNVNKLHKRSKGPKKVEAAPGRVPKAEPKKVTKKNRVWDDSPKETKLDYTDGAGEDGEQNMSGVVADVGESMMDKEEIVGSDSECEEGEEETEKDGGADGKKKGWFSSMFQRIAGKANLEKSDLEPALKALKDRLMTKNVAEEIAEKLCDSVTASLEGKKLPSFTRVSSTVQAAMEDAIVRILTPRRSIDFFRDVHAAKEQGKPYVVVFVGVNGVGKSTNLAKVAYWLQQHNINVTMAACDTFRSGAIEQLRTHARNLQIPVFEKGYEKDAAIVAKEAIQEATRNGSDVVLVDTAGRMQDNEPLMRALYKLIHVNNPDLVLFVGEALVGNDAVDQSSKFNQKLRDLSSSSDPRFIDGILLTKFDTIDDKVGAALSMVYLSGAPVMFVGSGFGNVGSSGLGKFGISGFANDGSSAFSFFDCSDFGKLGSSGFGNSGLGNVGNSGLGKVGSSGFGNSGFGTVGNSGFGNGGSSGFGHCGNSVVASFVCSGFGKVGNSGFGNSGFGSVGSSGFGNVGISSFGSGGSSDFGNVGISGFGNTGISGFGNGGSSGFGNGGNSAFTSFGCSGFGKVGNSGFGNSGFGNVGNSGLGSSGFGNSGFGNVGSLGLGSSGFGNSGFGNVGNSGLGSSGFGNSGFGNVGNSGLGSSGFCNSGFGSVGNSGFGNVGSSGFGKDGISGLGGTSRRWRAST